MKDNLVEIPCTVVGINDIKSFVKDGQEIKYASIHIRVGTALMKIKVSPENASLLSSATALLDKTATVSAEVFPGQGMVASLRALSIVARK